MTSDHKLLENRLVTFGNGTKSDTWTKNIVRALSDKLMNIGDAKTIFEETIRQIQDNSAVKKYLILLLIVEDAICQQSSDAYYRIEMLGFDQTPLIQCTNESGIYFANFTRQCFQNNLIIFLLKPSTIFIVLISSSNMFKTALDVWHAFHIFASSIRLTTFSNLFTNAKNLKATESGTGTIMHCKRSLRWDLSTM